VPIMSQSCSTYRFSPYSAQTVSTFPLEGCWVRGKGRRSIVEYSSRVLFTGRSIKESVWNIRTFSSGKASQKANDLKGGKQRGR